MKRFTAIIILFFAATVARADSVWTYAGNTLDYPIGVNLPGQPTDTSPYAVDGSVTINDAGEATAWDFTVGDLTFTQANTLSSSFFFQYYQGAISRWGVYLASADGWLSTDFNGSYSDSQDESSNGAYVRANPGTWSEPVSTPEPPALLFLFVSLAAALGIYVSHKAIRNLRMARLFDNLWRVSRSE